MTAAAPRTVATVVALVVPIALAAIGVVIGLIALPSAPADVVVGWGPSGERTAPAWTVPLMVGVLGLVVPLLLTLTAIRGRRVTDATAFLAGISLGTVALLTLGMTGAMLAQTEPTGAPSDLAATLGALVVAAIALGAGLVAAAWFLLPRDAPLSDAAAPVAPIDRPAGSRTVWAGTARSGRGLLVSVAFRFCGGRGSGRR